MVQRMPDTIRIGDAEREQAAEDLRSHALAGRLTMEEYSERLEAVYSARTFGDLRPIMADLPPLAAAEPPPPASPFPAPVDAPAPGHRRRARMEAGSAGRGGMSGSLWLAWVVVAVTLTAASHGVLWPVWIAGPWLWARCASRRGWGAPGRR